MRPVSSETGSSLLNSMKGCTHFLSKTDNFNACFWLALSAQTVLCMAVVVPAMDYTNVWGG